MTPIATSALLLQLPGALGAEQLEYGVATAGSWNDNVFGQSDFSARVSPFARVGDPEGDLTWSLRYQPSYEQYLDLSEVSGFDHDVQGSLSWRFADRWNLALRQTYVTNQSAILFNEASEPGQEVALAFEDQEVRSSRTSAVLSRMLTPRDELTLSIGYNALRFSGEGRGQSDPSSASAALAYQHALSERTSVGLRSSWVQQSRDNQVAEDDSSFFYNLSATFEHRFSPTLRLVASAGPTLVDSSPPAEFDVVQFATTNISFTLPGGDEHGPFALDADLCDFQGVTGRAGVNNFEDCSIALGPITDGQLPQEITFDELVELSRFFAPLPTLDAQGRKVGDVGGTDLTYFAYLALNKDWEHWKGTLSYTRSNSESASFGSSSVSDSFYATLSWKPDLNWTVSLAAGLSLQEQVGDQAVPFAVDLVNVPAPAGVNSVDEVAQLQSILAEVRSNALAYRTESISLAANRNIGRRSSVFVSLFWYTQEQDIDQVTSTLTRDVDALRVSVGVRWNFEPIRF